MLDLSGLLSNSKQGTLKTESNSSPSSSATTSSSSQSESKVAKTGEKKISLTLKGEVHSMVISEDGSVYDFNESDSTWAQRKDGSVYLFEDTDKDSKNTQGKNINLADIDVEELTFVTGQDVTVNLKKGTTLANYSQKNNLDYALEYCGLKDSEPSSQPKENYVVAVIDDFTEDMTVLNYTDKNASDVNIGLTHGDLVESIILSGNDDEGSTTAAQVLEYNINPKGAGLDVNVLIDSLENIVKRVNDDGEKIDAVNISLGVARIIGDYGLNPEDIDDWSSDLIVKKAEENGDDDLVLVLGYIKTLSDIGVSVYISSGNEGDDVYYAKDDETQVANKDDQTVVYSVTDPSTESLYNIFEEVDAYSDADGNITSGELYNWYAKQGYDSNGDNYISGKDFYAYNQKFDTNNDGVITGRELGVFNFLSLAKGENVHVVGAKDSIEDDVTDGIADYSNENYLVDAKANGDVKLEFVLHDKTTNQYGYDLDGDGKVDYWGSYELNANEGSGAAYDTDGDGNEDTYSYDIDGDGDVDIYSTAYYSSEKDIQKVFKGNFFASGTSFSTPQYLKEDKLV